jgi:catechol 2,3-dioxygenase-like lactoylglutathione lyase family enzyme
MTDSLSSFHYYTILLRVSDLAKSIEWYERVMDMNVSYRDLGYPLVTVEDVKGNRLTLWAVTKEEPPIVPMTRESAMIAFVTESIEATRALLIERGADASQIIDYRTGVRSVWVHDPDNHALLFVQILPE